MKWGLRSSQVPTRSSVAARAGLQLPPPLLTPALQQEILLGRGFTFWQWFDGVLDLTKRCLRSYWSDR